MDVWRGLRDREEEEVSRGGGDASPTPNVGGG